MNRIGWSAALLIAVAGCGLSDYERRLDEQREKLRLFDEEALILSDVIEMPTGKDAYGNAVKPPYDIFLRFPKAISPSFQGPAAIYVSDKQPLYRYYGKTEVNIFVAMAKVYDKLSLNKPAADELSPEEFRSKVRGGLIEFVAREYKGMVSVSPPDFDKLKSETRETLRDGKPYTVRLESIDFSDSRVQNPTRFQVFFQTLQSRQAAVIYQFPVPMAADQSWQRAVDVSIKTFTITNAASSMRSAYKSRQ